MTHPTPDLIPHRILRAEADDLYDRTQDWRPKTLKRHEYIRNIGLTLLARHGRARVTFKGLAAAVALSQQTLAMHFIDLDAFIEDILLNHLYTLAEAVTPIQGKTPAAYAARRQAWLAATRMEDGDFTPAHTILLRDRHLLPEDLFDEIDGAYQGIGEHLAPENTHAETDVLARIDRPTTTQANVESLFPATPAKLAAPAPKPAPTRPPPPPRPPAPPTAPQLADEKFFAPRTLVDGLATPEQLRAVLNSIQSAPAYAGPRLLPDTALPATRAWRPSG
jgi:AcrR family transcriptional regulator